VTVAPETGLTEIKIEEEVLDPPQARTRAPLEEEPPVVLGHCMRAAIVIGTPCPVGKAERRFPRIGWSESDEPEGIERAPFDTPRLLIVYVIDDKADVVIVFVLPCELLNGPRPSI